MVVLNENLQVIESDMEDDIVVRSRGGGCLVKHPPLFSADGKYIYVLCDWCVNAYSVQSGECSHQFVTERREKLTSIATYGPYLLTVTATGVLTKWKTDSHIPQKVVSLDIGKSSVISILPVTSQKKHIEFDLVVTARTHKDDIQPGEPKEDNVQLWLYSSQGNPLSNLFVRAENKPHSVCVCDQYAATIKKDRLTVVPFANNIQKTSMLAGGGRTWMAVSCSPSTGGLAAGDNSGRILYWAHPLESKARAVFHWHTLPVAAITFSASGSYMYSGGGEGVMVRWNLDMTNVRNFLPRLPAPILHLSVCPDNQHVAVSTQDNGIQVVDSQNRICSVIQRLSWGLEVNTETESNQFPAGLVWDPRSQCLVLNGRPGHLQFFNTVDNKLVYNLDITGQNLLSQERDKRIINAEVTHVTISRDGKWMITAEKRDDNNSFSECLLKFWQYKFNSRQFSLNTCIQNPHEGRLNSIKCQTGDISAMPVQYLLVTTGTDGKFRLWIPTFSDIIHKEEQRWICDSVGCYRNLTPEVASFSADGSVLGVSFGATLTLWDAEVCQLSSTLTHDQNHLRAVEFGCEECCHLVVTASHCDLMVWSILSLSIVWRVSLETSVLTADSLSSHIAVFTADRSLFVFLPSNPKPVYQKKSCCESGKSVLAAMFVPRPLKLLNTRTSWCASSQLHFVNSDRELQYLEFESEEDPEQILRHPVASSNPLTPFSVLTAKTSSSDTDKIEDVKHLQFGTCRDTAVRKLLSNPAHTMPHIHLLCASFLKAFVITRETEKDRKATEEGSEISKAEVVGSNSEVDSD